MDGGWLTAIVFAALGAFIAVYSLRPPPPRDGDARPTFSFPWWVMVLIGVAGGGAYLYGALRNGRSWWWVVAIGVVVWLAAAACKRAVERDSAWVERFRG